MAIAPDAKGRSYGPFRYEVGAEKLREFALAVGGGVPSSSFSAADAPADMQRLYVDADYAKTTQHGSLVAPPTFCVVFNIRPFAAAVRDPQNQVNFLMLVHGEQEYEFLEPVKPGDVLTTTGKIEEAYSRSGKDFLTVVCESVNQRGQLAVRGTYTAVIRS
ncbi:MAG: MaoC family dehydratase N-terminal domain-containing protein [Deltaproteobacteria bacterium]|nr:MaoC family dehydratase N-terminal domain-containing protein [Deltaproteobacteria bacterium]